MVVVVHRPRPLSTATDLTDYTDRTDQTDQTDQTDHAIEADPDNRSLSSADYDAELRSCTAEAFEAVQQYGRTYNKFCAGAYPFPNDVLENERLQWQHCLIQALFLGRNWFAPIHRLPLKRPKKVLDIGCGTGIWCIQMAKKFSRSHVVGIDLSPIQPKIVPTNCEFVIDDIRDRAWWGKGYIHYFDYIHTRMSLGIFRDFREIIQKGFNNLEPGGWMESQELYSKVYCDDNTMPATWPLLQWSKDQDEAAMKLGTPLRIANKLKTWYEQAGFLDVKEEVFRVPINEWAKEDRFKMYGKFMAQNMQGGLYGWTVDYFHRAFGWTEDQIRVECARVHKSLNDRNVHAYFKIYVVYGRKPHIGEAPSQVPKPDHWPTVFTSCNEDDASSMC
ncbi:uncharacterized protein EKO05_0009640 [Ascochyta rabiei]|uniref:uncharacterized protein n=1 Tax=Didymella rabiei TaxID=5454 RepID=UPI0021FF011A|nr:uncharacterized protein EKO05_0009640 [Ascochyta rabiei]UPX19374.1 hypothetical protein EKO05_0009640 [Ascochyta rabiei]